MIREDGLIHNTTLFRFDSLGEMAQAADEKGPTTYNDFDSNKDQKTNFGGDSWNSALRKSNYGDEARVEEAEAFLRDIAPQIDTSRPVYIPSVAGSLPIVPAALAGHPLSMRKRINTQDQMGAIRIYADLVSSQGISHKQLEKRGLAILALASKLSEHRAVELFAVAPMGKGGYGEGRQTFCLTYPISSSPLNLALAVHALANVAVTRLLAYAYLEHHGADGSWGWTPPSSPEDREKYIKQAREVFNLEGEDLYIPPPYLNDDIAKDPVAWVKSHLDKLQAVEE